MWKTFLTTRAYRVRARIAASPNNAGALMEERVIRVVLAYHEISISVVRFIAVNVMNLRANWQRLPERLLRNKHMCLDFPCPRIPDRIRHPFLMSAYEAMWSASDVATVLLVARVDALNWFAASTLANHFYILQR